MFRIVPAFVIVGLGAFLVLLGVWNVWSDLHISGSLSLHTAINAFFVVVGLILVIFPQGGSLLPNRSKMPRDIDLARDTKSAKRLLLFQSFCWFFFGASQLWSGFRHSDSLTAGVSIVTGIVLIVMHFLLLLRYRRISKEGTDPVPEASIYLAYGMDAQAEKILKAALLAHPDRIAIHRKLAEIYAKHRDAWALLLIATQARELTHGQGTDWLAIAALGSKLDPANSLYQHSST